MGVPAFFRWLSVRYPKVILDALSEDELEVLFDDFKNKPEADPNEIEILDGDLPNKIESRIAGNNPQFDNLYLDMNGIIHPCCHPQGQPQPKSEIEMFNNIFAYTDKIMRIVRPQKLLYMAIDGVAPRAKMNQQRARRFRSAFDAIERDAREAEIRSKWNEQGIKFTDGPAQGDDEKWDQNVITPGTEFMWKLSKALQFFVMERLQSHELWKGVKVIFSDASVPGEGEHKILDFIRSQRCAPGYDPNTRHCIYGADADLIMLGLSTHEPHFCILREAIMQSYDQKCTICGKQGHLSAECRKNDDHKKQSAIDSTQLARAVQFQFVKLNVVREYLYLEFRDMELPFQFDFERVIDDFVFMCFFVGNDFLPHLPSLHIREGAIDSMMVIYKNLLPTLGGYLTKEGVIDFGKVDLILHDIAQIEEEFFRIKKQQNDRQEYRKRENEQRDRYQQERLRNSSSQRQSSSNPPEDSKKDSEPVNKVDISLLSSREIEETKDLTNEEKNQWMAKKLKEVVTAVSHKENDAVASAYVDKVVLGTEGWKQRYYREKFHVDPRDLNEFVDKIKQAYIEGLQWVYSYYYKGCVSWYWFYPFHYAPFASDLVNCDRVKLKFEMGEPSTPFEQLMAVFPKQSSHAVPSCYRHLFSDPQSVILDFYPTSMRRDLNGARYAWMGVELLPFIDRERLVAAMKKVEKLSLHEIEMNLLGYPFMFMAKDENSKGALQITLLKSDFTTDNLELFACYKRFDAISGTVKGYKNAFKLNEPITVPSGGYILEQITDNQVFQIKYDHPRYEKHLTKLLEGCVVPKREVEDFEIYHVDRRFFQGESAVRLLERIVGIDSSITAIYKSQGNYSGYQNNHAEYQGVQGFNRGNTVESYISHQDQSNLGKRRREDDNYQGGGGYDRQQRQRTDYQQNQYQGRQQNYYQNQQYQQQPYRQGGNQGYYQQNQQQQYQDRSQQSYNPSSLIQQFNNPRQQNPGQYQQQNYQQQQQYSNNRFAPLQQDQRQQYNQGRDQQNRRSQGEEGGNPLNALLDPSRQQNQRRQ